MYVCCPRAAGVASQASRRAKSGKIKSPTKRARARERGASGTKGAIDRPRRQERHARTLEKPGVSALSPRFGRPPSRLPGSLVGRSVGRSRARWWIAAGAAVGGWLARRRAQKIQHGDLRVSESGGLRGGSAASAPLRARKIDQAALAGCGF